MKLLLKIVFCLFVASAHLGAQALSGTYTLGPSSTEYPTFNAAFDSLQALGVSGPVVFEIEDGIYEEQVTAGVISGSNPLNTITFRSVSGIVLQ